MPVTIREITHKDTIDLRHRVMWPNHPVDFVKLPEDPDGIHFGLFKSDDLISIVSLFINGDEAQFRKLATEKKEQNNGYGSRLLFYLMEYASERNLKRIWCNARKNKTTFYKKFGLERTNITYTKGGIDFIVLERLF